MCLYTSTVTLASVYKLQTQPRLKALNINMCQLSNTSQHSSGSSTSSGGISAHTHLHASENRLSSTTACCLYALLHPDFASAPVWRVLFQLNCTCG